MFNIDSLLRKPVKQLGRNEQRSLFMYLSSLLEFWALSEGIHIICFTYHRTQDEQNRLVNSSRDVTSTKHSRHTRWLAKDYVVIDSRGRADWKADDEYLKMGEFWERIHPETAWGGRWEDPYDPYHFQLGGLRKAPGELA